MKAGTWGQHGGRQGSGAQRAEWEGKEPSRKEDLTRRGKTPADHPQRVSAASFRFPVFLTQFLLFMITVS